LWNGAPSLYLAVSFARKNARIRGHPRHLLRALPPASKNGAMPDATAPSCRRGKCPRVSGLRALGQIALVHDRTGFEIKPMGGPDLGLDLFRQLRVVAEELLGVLAALADAFVTGREPGAGFLDYPGLHAKVDQLVH